MDYPAGSLKQHPATLSIALRTDSPQDSFTAWSVASVDQPPRYVPGCVVRCWPDLMIGLVAFTDEELIAFTDDEA
jgi:hypothetical protein